MRQQRGRIYFPGRQRGPTKGDASIFQGRKGDASIFQPPGRQRGRIYFPAAIRRVDRGRKGDASIFQGGQRGRIYFPAAIRRVDLSFPRPRMRPNGGRHVPALNHGDGLRPRSKRPAPRHRPAQIRSFRKRLCSICPSRRKVGNVCPLKLRRNGVSQNSCVPFTPSLYPFQKIDASPLRPLPLSENRCVPFMRVPFMRLRK
jgi:hypothetical protein